MSEFLFNKLINIETLKTNIKYEIKKKELLQHQIKEKKEEININKYNLSEFSLFLKKNKTKKNILLIIKELKQNNMLLSQKNKIIKKDLAFYKEKYNNFSLYLEKNIEQLKYIKTTAEEQNFMLENKLKEKEALIKTIKYIIFDLSLGSRNTEIIKEIDNDYYKKDESFDKITEQFFEEQRENYNQSFMAYLMKQNRIINKNKKLVNEKTLITEYIVKNIYNNNDNISNEMIIQTNVSTDDSIQDNSSILDTEEQNDIKFTDNEQYSSKKLLISNNNNNKNILVPPLDLRLINYNKQNNLSYREKSLSRNFNFFLSDDTMQNENLIEEDINKIKNIIRQLKKRNKNLEIKIKKYEDKIGKIALNLYSK